MTKNNNLNWKLAIVCPMTALVLSGCYNRYPNVIEEISSDKMLIKDIKDGQNRMVDFHRNRMVTSEKTFFDKRTRFSRKGDTVIVLQEKEADSYKESKCLPGSAIEFDENLIKQRQQQHMFDSLNHVMILENQGTQR